MNKSSLQVPTDLPRCGLGDEGEDDWKLPFVSATHDNKKD